MNKSEIRDLFMWSGGCVHGPHVETYCISEADFYQFLEAYSQKFFKTTNGRSSGFNELTAQIPRKKK